ncbi:amino acid adenylation domain-containing protein, partial [Corallococcus sp. c25j21]|nr:amino acid adenylation domain-containing protein [Corallococcus silvisoli]
AQPDAPLSSLELLSSSERQQLLLDWNQTDADFPRDTCIHHVVAAQARLTPHAVAVRMAGRTVSYAALDAWAHQLALHLLSAGVSRGSRVAVLAERSPELVAGLLAVLKAGAAYVPVSPGVPPDRLAFMLEDSASSVLLAPRHRLPSLASVSAHVLPLETDFPSDASPLPVTPVGPDDLAYVIYTSGSTGRPKGVAVHHRGLMNLVSWHQRTYALSPDDSTALTAGVAFDASTWEVWPSLASGASLVVPPDAVRAEPALLLSWLATESITTCFMPTPLAEAVLREEWPRPIALRALLTGGDALHHGPPPSVPASLFNHYGPTESTVVATFTPVSASRDDGARPPIGRPISNTRTYVLDARLRPVPVGVPGELFLASEGLAWGYLGQPALTAERFLPHPFSSTPGARLYRTGDVVRWRADGQLDYLQRLDFQVKIRGFRIELGEIEASLLNHPQVHEAVVLAREDSPGDKRLVAYVVPTSGHVLDTSVLRAFLKERLPEYMVPAAYVGMESLPLNANGKVDRKALPTPDASPRADFIAPRNPTEQKLAEVFAQVLRVERVGIHDDFFALGGHSLLATQLVSRVRATLRHEFPVRALFEAPTVAALAERIDSIPAAPSSTPIRIPPLHATTAPLSFAQQRLWLLDQLRPGSAAYNIPTALRLKGALDGAALRRAFEALVARHETLRTTLFQQQGQPAQRIHSPATWTLPLVDLSALPEAQREEEARRLAAEEAQRPFDLGVGPLLRTSLVRLSEAEHVLLVTMHHIVSDGWSMGILVREMVAFYEAFITDRTPALAPLPVQYAGFAVWQQGWLQGETLEAQLGYWKAQLGGAPVALELPTDRPRPPVQSHRGSTVSVHVPLPVSEAIKTLAQREGATPFMALLGAFQLLLSRYSGQDDIRVGSPIAGRTQEETEGLIGFFINTLVLRARVEPRATFKQLLAQVRGTTLSAYEHQHLPFEKLVEALQPVRDLSRSALFQAMFVLQNAPIEALQMPGLSFEQLPLDSHSAKFDLTLTLQDSPQGFRGVLEYATDLFEASTVQRMAGHLGVLLEAIA